MISAAGTGTGTGTGTCTVAGIGDAKIGAGGITS
jgi:hypothetical protein